MINTEYDIFYALIDNYSIEYHRDHENPTNGSDRLLVACNLSMFHKLYFISTPDVWSSFFQHLPYSLLPYSLLPYSILPYSLFYLTPYLSDYSKQTRPVTISDMEHVTKYVSK